MLVAIPSTSAVPPGEEPRSYSGIDEFDTMLRVGDLDRPAAGFEGVVDEPGAGYSYHLPREDGSTPEVKFDAYAEAADYLRRYIAANPPDVATAQLLRIKNWLGGALG